MRLLIAALILVVMAGAATAETVRSLSMKPGDSLTVDYPPGSTVKVSRKGVIDVFSTSETSWQLTALRGGIVIIDAFDASGQPHLPRLFIEVKAKDEDKTAAVSLSLPQWICTHQGISCPDGSGIVRGTTNDYQWFLRTKSWCNTTRHCALHARLSGPAKEDLTSYLKDLLPAYDIEVSLSGRIVANAPCDGTTLEQHLRAIDALVPRASEERVLHFSCSGDRDTYRVSVRVKKVSLTEGKTIGYDGKLQHELNIAPSSSQLTGHAALKAEAMETKSETIGEPSFIASGNREFETLIGGELPYMTQSEHQAKSYQWKEYGLSIKGMLWGTVAKQNVVRGSFEIFLKTINSNASGGLHSSSLKSNMTMPLNVWTNLGELDLNSDVDERRSVPFASHIPIIGPLFRSLSTAQSHNKLQIWAHIEHGGQN